MATLSAGIIPYRINDRSVLEVMIVHPGGPFWAKKDAAAWSIAKGEYLKDEDPLSAAEREFREETGKELPDTQRIELGEVKQPSGKLIRIWAVNADIEVTSIDSNLFEMEWPPKSGKTESFPEADKAGWFNIAQARVKLVKGQLPFLDLLIEKLGIDIDKSILEGPVEPVQASLF